MSIQGIGQYGGFYQNYRTPSIPSITIDEAKQNQAAGQIVNNQQEALQSTQSEESLGLTTSDRNGEDITNRPAKTNTDLQDISLVFNKNDNFDYIGKDSEIGNLDVQKAISDMKKDQVLQEYQYFVGDLFSGDDNKKQLEMDGLVFLK